MRQGSGAHPTDDQAADRWDQWWRVRLARDTLDTDPDLGSLRIHRYWGTLFNLGCNDSLLVHVMREYGLRTVLCAGNGVSREPRALAAAGFDVTALDVSSVAVEFAKADLGLGYFVAPRHYCPGGRVQFVVGDLLNPTVCPGPFDVVIERRTVERSAEHERGAALAALAGRLSQVGIFLSMCFDDNFPMDLGWSQHDSGLFHASESWFREHGWTIWDGVPSSALVGRVALLVRIGSPKRRPDDRPTR